MPDVKIRMKDFFRDSLHIFILFSLAVAHPLLDVLAKDNAFFVVRGHNPEDVWLFVLLLCLLFPAVLVLFEGVFRLVSPKVQQFVHALILAILFCFLFLGGIKTLGIFTGKICIAISLALCLSGLVAYFRLKQVRSFMTLLLPVIVVVPAIFLTRPFVSRFLSSPEVDLFPGRPHVVVKSDTPVVLVVLDELPVSSLLNKDLAVDPVTFPNLAGFAAGSTWFRNATASSDMTPTAIPSLLTGRYPRKNVSPSFQDYPENLFTLLENSYEMKVFESGSRLRLPAYLTSIPNQPHLIARIRSLLADASAVYLQVVLPAELAGFFPDVDQGWSGFWRGRMAATNEHRDGSRAEKFQDFLNSIKPESRPALYYLHSVLPHGPFEYLPSGFKYNFGRWTTPIAVEDNLRNWKGEDQTANRAFQRHLLQLGYVDRLLGAGIERLKQTGSYDKALIILTADHGTSFVPNQQRRKISSTNLEDICLVPLFVKFPHQEQGVVSEKNVELVDILPTITDVLNISLPWQMDGSSVLNEKSDREIKRTIAWFFRPGEQVSFAQPDLRNSENLKRKLALFGSGFAIEQLYRFGPFPDLVGQPANDVSIVSDPSLSVELQNTKWYRQVNLNSRFVPALVTGRIRFHDVPEEKLVLALAFNGIVQAVTQTFRYGVSEELEFAVIVPDSAFRQGSNDVVIYRVEQNGEMKLRMIPFARNKIAANE